jgi:hypothetical protein
MLSTSSPTTTALLPLLLLLTGVCKFSHAFLPCPLVVSSSSLRGQYHANVLQQQHGPQQHQRQQQHQQFVTTTTTTTSTRLYDASFGPWRDSLDDNNHPDDFDVEAARERLESLVLDTGGAGAGGAGAGGKSSSGEKTTTSGDSTSAAASRFSQSSSSPSSSQSPLFSFASLDQHNENIKNINNDNDNIFPFTLPRRRTVLTSIERERREAEIQLLSRLAQGDDVLVEIWALWFQERGPQAAARLVQAEELMTMTTSSSTSTSTPSSPSSSTNNSNPEQQVRFRIAEMVLLNLIREYGVDWSEPMNRLATLYYKTGRLHQAARLCLLVLENKPWHFGTLSGIVMVYASLQDSNAARHWAAHRLPTFASIGPNRRRQFWVETAVAQAQESLEAAERRALNALGEPDTHHNHAFVTKPGQQRHIKNNNNNNQEVDDDDDDAWQ